LPPEVGEEPTPLIDTSQLEVIDINKLKPDAKTLKQTRKRIATDIGEGWWKSLRTAPGAKTIEDDIPEVEEASSDE
jgi:hypothetical protein